MARLIQPNKVYLMCLECSSKTEDKNDIINKRDAYLSKFKSETGITLEVIVAEDSEFYDGYQVH